MTEKNKFIGGDPLSDAIIRLETAISASNNAATLRRLIRESLQSLYTVRHETRTRGFEVPLGSMVYENVLKCLELLKPLEVKGEPNTLLALVEKAMKLVNITRDPF